MISKGSVYAPFCLAARPPSRNRNLLQSSLHARASNVSDSSFSASNLVFEGRCVRDGRINRINASSTAAGLTPSRNAKCCTFQGSFVLMFEELMKANRA